MPLIRNRRVRQRITALSFVFVLFSNCKPALCQEALRMISADQQSAAYEKKTSELGYYNLSLGPVQMRFQGETAIEFNDNVEYTETNRQADIILSPTLNADLLWPVTEQNALRLSISAGYVDYLKTSSLSHLSVSPDSGLVFKIYTGDFTINFHDRFSIVENVAQSPTVSGTGDFGQLENTIGFGVNWNLYKLILSFGYDYDMEESTTSGFDEIDHNSELFTFQTALLLHETTRLGLQLGGGITTYDQSILNNNTDISLGPFYEARLSEHITTALSGGYVYYMFASNGSSNALVNNPIGANNIGGYYANLSLTHQVNRWLTQSLSGNKQFELGVTANLVNLYSITYQDNWTFIRKVNLTTQLLYQHGTTYEGVLQTLDIYGGGIGVAYDITKKLTGSVNYYFQLKKSDPTIYNYSQNRLVFDFRYSF